MAEEGDPDEAEETLGEWQRPQLRMTLMDWLGGGWEENTIDDHASKLDRERRSEDIKVSAKYK